MALNYKQDLFAHEYIVDYNGTQAAIRAGYSAKTAGSQSHRMLKNVDILARVKELQAEQTQRLCITADWVVQKLVEVTQKSLQELPVEEWNHDERRMKPTGEYTYDSRGAAKALELIGRHLGMFTDQINVTGNMVVIKGEDDLED